MKRAARAPPSPGRKVQHVSCPCCEARLALHFIRGEDEVYDLQLLGSSSIRSLQADGGSSGPILRECAAFLEYGIARGIPREVLLAGAALISLVHCCEITRDDKNRVHLGFGDAIEAVAAPHSTYNEGNDVYEAINQQAETSATRDSVPIADASLEEGRRVAQSPPGLQPKTEALGNSKLFPLFYRPKKVVHLVRHGQTSMWVNPSEATNDEHKFDLRLTALGHQQAIALAPKMALLKPDLILVSPLRRALETLQGAFPNVQEGKERVEVTALHAEHVSCSGDIGRPPEVLAKEYPWLSFDALPEVWWYSHSNFPNNAMKMEFNSVEPMEELRKRVGMFRKFLRSRPECSIVVIGHSTFFKELTSTRQRMRNCEVQTLML